MGPMARPQPFTLIDTLREGSVSFAPPDPSDPDSRDSATGGHAGAAGAGHPVGTSGMLGGASRDGVSGYPIQVGKVQRPPLREETLARHRLLDWLDVKIHNRVVFVIAEAGYGKTTLLADFSRRTRLRTLWYRMDEEDRNWVTFMSYLVAAGREHDPDFAPRAYALLQDTRPGGPHRDEAVAMFLRELPDIAPTPTVLILDDFHVTDGSGDVSYVARNLVAKAPERLTVVISSRRVPEIPVGRLRAQGELAELRTRDLQFSEPEIAELFNANVREPLDQDSLLELNQRSEGWAASLELIRTAIRDRSRLEVREFIRNLTGGQAELYDYLAEEVVGDLSPEQQEFLMRTSVLMIVTVPAAAAICDVDAPRASRLVEQSERLGLISGQGPGATGFRYHPLVREFLASRLAAAIGKDGVMSLHRAVAVWAEDQDWRTAAHHYEAASEIDAMHRVLDRSIDSIAGQGGYEAAAEYLSRHKPASTTSSFEIIGSRIAYRRGNLDSAVHRAEAAVALDSSDAALNNAMTMHTNVGDHEGSWALAKQLAASTESSIYRAIAEATCLRYEASLDGQLGDLIDLLKDIASQSESGDLTHFKGVSYLNLSLAEQARGDLSVSATHASLAISSLAARYGGDELSSAYLARASASAGQGLIEEARADIDAAAEVVSARGRGEWLIEAADIETSFGSASTAAALVAEARDAELHPSLENYRQTIQTRLALRVGDTQAARDLADSFEVGRFADIVSLQARQLAVQAHVAVQTGSDDASDRIEKALRLADRQGALWWSRYCRVLVALGSGATPGPLDALIRRTPSEHLSTLDVFAEAIVGRLHSFEMDVRERISQLCDARSERWLPALRAEVVNHASPSRWKAGEILDVIGTTADIPTLRGLARSSKRSVGDPSLGRSLARRLAPRFLIEDLGRVEVISSPMIATSGIRRKVLAMLCYLLTRPNFAATRDEVIDALWPDLAPDVAVNSLNQTVYFLRRVFEPTYDDDLSAGYVHHSSDLLWLDRELISSRSGRCLAIIDEIGNSTEPSSVGELSREYSDRFALDFAYDEWAVPFRTSLHVAYLQVIESAVTRDMASGHQDRAIELARRALELDPAIESLELALVRLYRATGAHSAAAEQYAHYAAVLKDELGIDPPPLSSI